ncbi:MAG TPA: S41 family peptidase [Candidatus Elarobacter sp.]
MLRRVVSLSACVALLAAVPFAAARAQDATAALPSLAEPSISPDHSEIAFVSGGDIWSVPAGGGVARLLASTAGAASRPLFSPDGKKLAYVSSAPGALGIYVVTLDGGTLARVTHDDVVPNLSGWSPDGRYVYFSTSAHNLYYFGDVMRVAVNGGTPMRVVGERYVNAMDAAPSPDGSAVAYVRDGFLQWWRRGHSHMDESAIVVAHLAPQRFESVTDESARNRWPMWSPDGATLYFVSDRSGTDEIWARSAAGTRQLTHVHGEPILWPTISRDGRTIAFEHALRVWTCDVTSGAVRALAVELRGQPEAVAPQHVTLTSRFSALDLSPDGKKVAFVARGRVFAASAQEGGGALAAVSAGDVAADVPAWSHDSRQVAYTVDRGLEQAIATYAFPDGPERIVTPAGHHDDYARWSPDGKELAFVRDGREVHLMDVATRTDRVVARGVFDRRPFGDPNDLAFSPNGDWLAFIEQDAHGFSNVAVVPASGGTPRPISFLPNTNAGPLAWSPDGTRVYFVTSQRTENGQVAQVDLIPRRPRFKEDQFRSTFDEPTRPELPARPGPSAPPSAAPVRTTAPSPSPAARAKRTTIDFAGIRERLTLIPTGLDATRVAVAPDSKTLVIAANSATGQNLYTFSVDETESQPVAHQITATGGAKTSLAISPDGKNVVYLDGGRVATVPLAGGTARALPIVAELDVDFARDRDLMFRQTWSNLDRWYADPHFHGADWPAMLTRYAPYVRGARTPNELRRDLSLMIGELNSSHTGIGAPSVVGVPRWTTGRLGVQWDAQAYLQSGRLRIAELAPLGPLALAGNVAPGDDVVAIDRRPVTATTDVDLLLDNRVGKRTEVQIAPRGGGATRTVAVLPVDTPAEQDLFYRAWVASRRAYVEKISGGRLGYVHVPDMGEDSLRRFFTDLDVQNRERAGVVIDVRNNTGGFVDPYVIDVITRREYLRFRSRFGYDAPARTSLGQRALDRPTVLLVNEHSLSDSENLTEGYRTLHAGPVVGEPTAGWIIFTSGTTLVDGSSLRLPSTLTIDHNGVDMELHPRPVDVAAANPPGAAERGDDPQLDAAVRELERRTGTRR